MLTTVSTQTQAFHEAFCLKPFNQSSYSRLSVRRKYFPTSTIQLWAMGSGGRFWVCYTLDGVGIDCSTYDSALQMKARMENYLNGGF